MHPPITITAADLQEAAAEDAPRRPRGRPRKHPEGERPKYPENRTVPQQKVQPGSLADLARWKAAAAKAKMKLSPWIASVATAAADAQLGPAPSTD